MTKTQWQETLARSADIALRPRFEWNLLIMRLKIKLRAYKKQIENERTFVAPFGWEYRTGHIGQSYLWPINHIVPNTPQNK